MSSWDRAVGVAQRYRLQPVCRRGADSPDHPADTLTGVRHPETRAEPGEPPRAATTARRRRLAVFRSVGLNPNQLDSRRALDETSVRLLTACAWVCP